MSYGFPGIFDEHCGTVGNGLLLLMLYNLYEQAYDEADDGHGRKWSNFS
jgi:hypothetical protein